MFEGFGAGEEYAKADLDKFAALGDQIIKIANGEISGATPEQIANAKKIVESIGV